LETSISGFSRLYQFRFFEGDSLQIINSKNDVGLSALGWNKENTIKRMSEITRERFVEFREEKLAKNYAQSIYIFMRLLGTGVPYQCWENENRYLIYFPRHHLTLEGTKSKYDFEFKENENAKLYYFCANIENYTAEREIVKGYDLIDLDAISIYFIWQDFYDGLKKLDRILITLKFLSYEKVKKNIYS